MPAQKEGSSEQILRLGIVINGAVQGVGFRPFIYRLATDMELGGWVNNSAQGLFVEVEGYQSLLATFLLRIEREKPPQSFIQSLESRYLDPQGYKNFEIRASDSVGEKSTLVLSDIATCVDCLNDILAVNNRRYLYPFTNCTNCGPRFSIIESIPYDRTGTTMKVFKMCDQCQAEYENPRDRRFHAQPNACSLCGPRLMLWDRQGKELASEHKALLMASAAIRQGAIVAVKGVGGFHLLVDARNEAVVSQLRRLKDREEKPFALLYPNLAMIKQHCEVSVLEERLLCAPEAPIVLLYRREFSQEELAPSVAPDNPYLGIMLPDSPLHHLIMRELGFPVVATSGNISAEPICTDEHEALARLNNVAELFLVHNRPIARHVDDSIVRIIMGREMVLRRARGYAPLPITIKAPIPPLLSVGAHLKSSIAISCGKNLFVSQHIGDLTTAQAFNAFTQVINDLQSLYSHNPCAIVCDAHPHYLSTKFTEQSNLPVIYVQHHYAHVLSGMAENELEGDVLGVSWDGTGYGLDGTIWGGEFLQITADSFERVAHLRPFRLPGGEKAIKEPRRVALGLLYELFGDELFTRQELAPIRAFSLAELKILQTMLKKGLNAPLTSSVGRLFDGVAAIVGLREQVNFEGQAALALEFALERCDRDEQYNFDIIASVEKDSPAILDWAKIVVGVLADLHDKTPLSLISAKFHNTLVEMIIAVAKLTGKERIVLTGGCFQNKYLVERAVCRLHKEGFRPYWHQRIPPNDGGIALGQAIAASRLLVKKEK